MPSKKYRIPSRARGAAQILFALALVVSCGSLEGAPAAVPFRQDRILIIPKAGRDAALANQHAVERAKVHRRFPALGNIQVLELPRGANPQTVVERYRRGGNVEAAELDYLAWRPAVMANDPAMLSGAQWHLHNNGHAGGTPDADIDAPEAWDILHSATNVIVAVPDTGIRVTHEDLAGNLWTNRNEIPDNGVDDDGNGYVDDVHGANAISMNGSLTDEWNHGTHVAGILGAVGNNGIGISGVAWKVPVMPLKFIGLSSGSDSDFVQCLDYARARGAKVVNCSVVSPQTTATISNAFWNLQNADILVCAAAGNGGGNNDFAPIYPASYRMSNLVAVMASSRNDSYVGHNYGPNSVHLAAPGIDIYSTGAGANNDYFYLSGTSMAAPMVAGAAALLRARFPNESSAQIIRRLLHSVDVLPGFAGRCITGGRLNLRKALDRASLPLFSVTNASYAWIPTNGMTGMVFSTGDGVNGPFSLPFAFPFYGRSYTQLWVSANGILGFTNVGLALGANADLPMTNAPNAIYPYWDDLNPLSGGMVWSGVAGAAPNRKAVVTWNAVPHHNPGGGPFTFQVVLHESGQVTFQYQEVEQGSTVFARGKSATVGLEEPSGLFGTRHSFNGFPVQLTNQQALLFLPEVVHHPPPGLLVERGPAPGTLRLILSAEPAQPAAVLASTNLTSWSMIYSNVLPASGLVSLSESNTAPQKFYRAVSGPFLP